MYGQTTLDDAGTTQPERSPRHIQAPTLTSQWHNQRPPLPTHDTSDPTKPPPAHRLVTTKRIVYSARSEGMMQRRQNSSTCCTRPSPTHAWYTTEQSINPCVLSYIVHKRSTPRPKAPTPSCCFKVRRSCSSSSGSSKDFSIAMSRPAAAGVLAPAVPHKQLSLVSACIPGGFPVVAQPVLHARRSVAALDITTSSTQCNGPACNNAMATHLRMDTLIGTAIPPPPQLLHFVQPERLHDVQPTSPSDHLVQKHGCTPEPPQLGHGRRSEASKWS